MTDKELNDDLLAQVLGENWEPALGHGLTGAYVRTLMNAAREEATIKAEQAAAATIADLEYKAAALIWHIPPDVQIGAVRATLDRIMEERKRKDERLAEAALDIVAAQVRIDRMCEGIDQRDATIDALQSEKAHWNAIESAAADQGAPQREPLDIFVPASDTLRDLASQAEELAARPLNATQVRDLALITARIARASALDA